MTAAPSSALVGNTTALLPEPIIGSSDRLANTTASLPIVYGSMAFYLGKKADEMQTHEWTLFLRGPNDNSNNQDHYTLNSLVISKVVFQLHPSFAQPTRELTEPPYEVTERGWGEFEAQIQIHWKDPTEQPTIVNHTIKLYPPKPPGSSKEDKAPPQSTEKPVLAEMYDEVVFTNPSPSFFHSLTQLTGVEDRGDEDEDEEDPLETAGSSAANKNESTTTRASLSSSTSTPSSWRDHLHNVYSDQDDFLALIAAQKFLQSELSGVKQRFQNVNEEMALVDQKLLLAQQQLQRDAAAAAVRGSTATTSGDPSSGNKRKKGSRSSSSSQKKSRTTPTAAASNNSRLNSNSKSSRKSPGVASSGVKANIKK